MPPAGTAIVRYSRLAGIQLLKSRRTMGVGGVGPLGVFPRNMYALLIAEIPSAEGILGLAPDAAPRSFHPRQVQVVRDRVSANMLLLDALLGRAMCMIRKRV
jgi:hypothetical protein